MQTCIEASIRVRDLLALARVYLHSVALSEYTSALPLLNVDFAPGN
jgi:hypothetical protein